MAHQAINITLVQRNWLLGRRIAQEELGDSSRAELYGRKVVPMLAKELTVAYGRASRGRASTSTSASTGCSRRLST